MESQDSGGLAISSYLPTVSLNLILILGMVIFAFPIYYLIVSSSFSPEQFYVFPPRMIPGSEFISNITHLIFETHYLVTLMNSLIFAGASTIAVLIISVMAGYAYAMYAFPGKSTLFYITLLSLAIPFQLVAIPLFGLMVDFGFVDSYIGLILPSFFFPIGLIIMKQSMEQALIEDILNSARIDGASELRIFWEIVLPLSKPGIAAVAVIVFIRRVNGLFWPLVITSSEEMQVATVFIANQQGPIIQTDWTVVMPAALLVSLFPLVVYFYLQKYFVKGLMSGSID
jgi:ABC-type glycerol-3-phosphate transport system permease component